MSNYIPTQPETVETLLASGREFITKALDFIEASGLEPVDFIDMGTGVPGYGAYYSGPDNGRNHPSVTWCRTDVTLIWNARIGTGRSVKVDHLTRSNTVPLKGNKGTAFVDPTDITEQVLGGPAKSALWRVIVGRGCIRICCSTPVLMDMAVIGRILGLLAKPKKGETHERHCSYTAQWKEAAMDGRFAAPWDPHSYRWYIGFRPNSTSSEDPGDAQMGITLDGLIGVDKRSPTLICELHIPCPRWIEADQPLWMIREAARLYHNAYEELPPIVVEALDWERLGTAYPHLAVKEGNQGMIAFTKDSAAGAADRQQVMKPGRFIKMYARDSSISDERVKQLSGIALANLVVDYHHTRDADEASHVYQSGPNSCMAYGPNSSRGEFDNQHNLEVGGEFVHPTAVYFHPENNLELVYGTVGDGNVVSRAIVNTERKTWACVYAKENPSSAEEQMVLYLKKLGYEHDSNTLHDEKLRRIDTDNGAIICPFLDPHNVGVSVRADYLIAGGREEANHATGTLHNYAGNDGRWTCDCCGSEMDSDDDSYRTVNDGEICYSCAEGDFIEAYCSRHGEERYVHADATELYSLRHVSSGPLAGYAFVLPSRSQPLSSYGLVALDPDRYEEEGVSMAANEEDCASDDDGNYILKDDVEEHDMFIDEDGDAHRIDEWACIVDEAGNVQLIELEDVVFDQYMKAPDAHEKWDMLPMYVPIKAEEEADEASAA